MNEHRLIQSLGIMERIASGRNAAGKQHELFEYLKDRSFFTVHTMGTFLLIAFKRVPLLCKKMANYVLCGLMVGSARNVTVKYPWPLIHQQVHEQWAGVLAQEHRRPSDLRAQVFQIQFAARPQVQILQRIAVFERLSTRLQTNRLPFGIQMRC